MTLYAHWTALTPVTETYTTIFYGTGSIGTTHAVATSFSSIASIDKIDVGVAYGYDQQTWATATAIINGTSINVTLTDMDSLAGDSGRATVKITVTGYR